MSFTYSGDPTSSDLDAVRFLVQDTDSTDILLQDEEILFVLGQVSNAIYQAAHDCCYVISSKFARKADVSKSVGDMSLSLTYSSRAGEYRTLANEFLELSDRREPPKPRFANDAMVNTTERTNTTPTTDFVIGQHDNAASRYGHIPYRW